MQNARRDCPLRRALPTLAAAAAVAAIVLSSGAARAQGEALAVILTPKTASNAVNSLHCVTATVVGATEPVFVVILVHDAATGELLFRSIGRLVPPDTTHSFCYQGPPTPRIDRITAFVDEDEDFALDPGEPFDEGSKVWIVETATPGQTAGGGHIIGVPREVVFSFNAQLTEAGLQGHCIVFDFVADVDVRCVDVDSLLIAGTHATFTGTAVANDVATRYTIDVDDLGEPGAGRDTFKIVTESGFVATGVLANGNVLVRPTL
jgi:hypothetical protein